MGIVRRRDRRVYDGRHGKLDKLRVEIPRDRDKVIVPRAHGERGDEVSRNRFDRDTGDLKTTRNASSVSMGDWQIVDPAKTKQDE